VQAAIHVPAFAATGIDAVNAAASSSIRIPAS
jgi:hypothetical protein